MDEPTGEITENEMALLHNALFVYLQYLRGLNRREEQSHELTDVVVDTYVDAKALREKLVAVLGRDATDQTAEIPNPWMS